MCFETRCLIEETSIELCHMQNIETNRLKALIFDVDGTLYLQKRVRYGMLWRLLYASARQPTQSLRTLRVLRAYRRAQEVLRMSRSEAGDIAVRQRQLTCEWTGVAPEFVEACVTRWMEQAPLALVASSRRAGVIEFLDTARRRGLRLGICSDYPPAAKLIALRLAHFFEVVVSAQDPEVQQFKPHPRGLETTLRRLGVDKSQALYIGDRPEVDAVAAWSAGIACVIIGRSSEKQHGGWAQVRNYGELQHTLWPAEAS
jgi:HAD superfamily hydrolase (TIGR01549 family)